MYINSYLIVNSLLLYQHFENKYVIIILYHGWAKESSKSCSWLLWA